MAANLTPNTGPPPCGAGDVQGALQVWVSAGQVEPMHREGDQPPRSRRKLPGGIPRLDQVPRWLR